MSFKINFELHDIDKIKILLEGRGKLENGANIWTSPYGCYEINYSDFVSEVQHFFDDLFLHFSAKNIYKKHKI